MNLMLATLTAKDRVDAFHADADAERLVALPRTPRTGQGERRYGLGWLTRRFRPSGRGVGA